MYKIILTENARLDIQEAIDWENSRATGLGAYFFRCLQEKIDDLKITPGMGSIRYHEVRCTVVKKFPYIIHYHVPLIGNEVIILRILHASRKPLH